MKFTTYAWEIAGSSANTKERALRTPVSILIESKFSISFDFDSEGIEFLISIVTYNLLYLGRPTSRLDAKDN